MLAAESHMAVVDSCNERSACKCEQLGCRGAGVKEAYGDQFAIVPRPHVHRLFSTKADKITKKYDGFAEQQFYQFLKAQHIGFEPVALPFAIARFQQKHPTNKYIAGVFINTPMERRGEVLRCRDYGRKEKKARRRGRGSRRRRRSRR